MKNLFKKGKKIYWWLIGTFALLYLAVAFVSTLHAITFFQLANTMGLAILLGVAYEVGQATVLFSILMSQNKNKILAWGMMFLLTALQISANVYASFKYMDASGSNDWTFWQRAILFGVQAENDEMYKVIISWISGALLPLVALGMTALVADNIKLLGESDEEKETMKEEKTVSEDDDPPLLGNLFKKKKKEEIVKSEEAEPIEEKKETGIDPDVIRQIEKEMEKSSKIDKINPKEYGVNLETKSETIKEPITVELQPSSEHELLEFDDGSGEIEEQEKTPPEESPAGITKDVLDIKPVNRPPGWHFYKEFVDEEHNVFELGKYIKNDPEKTPTSPKPKKA